MKLTKRKTLEICEELWDWLYHNPSKDKSEWPEWDFNKGKYPSMHHNCPCCEYIIKNVGNIVEHCPGACLLFGKWSDVDGRGCSMDANGKLTGYYTRWDYATSPKTRKKYAKKIRDIAREARMELKE